MYLFEFSRTESRNRSADLEVSKNDKAADKLSFELSAWTSNSAPLLQLTFFGVAPSFEALRVKSRNKVIESN